MKAVISNRIYMNCTPELQRDIDAELTYAIPTHNPLDPPQVIKNMGLIKNGLISLPVGRLDLIPSNYTIIDKRVTKPEDFPEFKFELRESQKKVYDDIEDNAIINAWVSWGKTFTGLAIAGKLGQKTLVVTHTVPLRNQWAKEVKKVFGFEPGIIGSGRFELDAPIVIGNTQTLYRNLDKIRKEFGTIILDEMHHVSSPTFSKILDTNYCRYKIGLSGTIERKDGKHVVFRDYFGNTLFQPPRENYMTPTINIVNSDIRFMDGARIPWANRVTNLSNNEEYRHTVALLAAAMAAKGHKVLVVSDRVAFLKACAELTGDKAVCVTGEVSHEDREDLVEEILTGDKNVLYGTQAIFSEGISVDTLSCLILATPINNEPLLTQLVGRVIRKREGKIDPVVIDIHLKGNTARKQASNRAGFYIKQGWDMKYL
jgi:superfamily II DNA or RNA helicase|tara:strand:+ start:18352 stop:19635 length:1284 start_codon:yes stop_codon:yes gene_type:complete